MASTQWTSIRAWDHLTKEVLQIPDILYIYADTVGCSNIDDFMYLGSKDFETAFEVTTSDISGIATTVRQTLTRVTIGKLLRAQKWFDRQPVRNYETWSQLTLEVLNNFRDNPLPSPPSIMETTPFTPTSSAHPHVPSFDTKKSESSVNTFIKSIKRSIDDYPGFNDGKHWFNWHRRIRTKAAAHGCDKVLDRAYVPGPDTEDLFYEQQKFMYDVFVEKVTTQRGRQIVRQFESSLDAQQVWATLCDEYASRVHAHISGATVEAELMAMRCDSTWTSCATFLTTWQLKLMDSR
jgi:hypothetical protein